jgi:hypothetical protein
MRVTHRVFTMQGVHRPDSRCKPENQHLCEIMARHYNIGLISRSAIRKFERRQRDSWGRYLEYSENKLNSLMERLPVQPPIWWKLTKRQKALFLIGAKLKRFAFFADTGEGKTLLSIALMRYFKKLDESRCNLVLVPNLSNKWEWATEGFDKHAPSVNYQVLDGSTDEKWLQFTETDCDVYIETYGGLMHMLCTLKKDSRKRKGKNNRLVPNKARIERLLKRVEGLIVDESTFAKSRDALPFRLCQRVAKRANIVFDLSATPFGRDPIDLWAQMFLVDQGYALGETLGLFRQTFYTSKKTFWGGIDWKFDKTNKECCTSSCRIHRWCWRRTRRACPNWCRSNATVRLALMPKAFTSAPRSR